MSERFENPLSQGLVFSALLHGGLLFICLLGLWKEKPPFPSPSVMSVEVVTLGPKTQAPRPSSTKHPTPPKAPQQKKAPPPPKKSPPRPSKPLEKLKSENMIPLLEKKLLTPPKVQKKEDPAPSKSPPKKTRTLKETSPPKKTSSSKRAPQKTLDHLLDAEEEPASLDHLLDEESTSQSVAPQVGTLSITEQDLIKQYIQQVWNPPPAAKGLNILVTLVVVLNSDGTVQSAEVDRSQSAVEHPLYQQTADTALRALHDPRFQLPLPTQKYSAWKELKLKFNPISYQ